MRTSRVLSVAAALMIASSACAADRAGVSVRLGTHGRFDRVVVSVPDGVRYSTMQKDDEESVQFSRTVQVSSPAIGTGSGILSLQPSAEGLTIRFKPGSVVHAIRLAGHLVLDIAAPAHGQHPAQPPAVAATVGSDP